MKPLRIGLLSPWYGGSHRRWADGLQNASRHEIDIYGLPARHWKWRMHGAALTLAEQVMTSAKAYDLWLADDMMDVAVFRALVGAAGYRQPVLTYFHENQVCYPVSPLDTDLDANRDQHYGYVNFTSALASDRVCFNSHYHKQAFFSSLHDFLSRMPDGEQQARLPAMESKATVLPLGMDLVALDRYRETGPGNKERPLIIWNHRWEYDKGPDAFLQLLLDLHAAGLDFDVALLGERGKHFPEKLADVVTALGDRVLANGVARTFPEYARWLWQADIAPVTACQDFFGGSVVEALWCDCHVILPNRLAYPEHVTDQACLYETPSQLFAKVAHLIQSGAWKMKPMRSRKIRYYDWSNLVDTYDTIFSRCVEAFPENGAS